MSKSYRNNYRANYYGLFLSHYLICIPNNGPISERIYYSYQKWGLFHIQLKLRQ